MYVNETLFEKKCMQYAIPRKKIQCELVKRCQKAKAISFYGFILFLPVSIAFSQICLAILALTYSVEAVGTKRFHLPRFALNTPLFCYLGVLLLTTLFSVDVSASFRGLKGMLTIVVCYLGYLSIPDRRGFENVLRLLIGSITLVALYGMLQHYLQVDLFRLSKPISFLKHVNNDLTAPVRVSGFSSYMTFGGQLAMMLPIILACFFAVHSLKAKILFGVAMACTTVTLLWTYTRSAWLGAGCAVLLLGYQVKGKKFVIGFLIFLVITLGLAYFQPALLDRAESMFRTKENIERIYTWESTLAMIKDYPILGIGKGNYSKLAPSYREQYDFTFTSRAHAHNNLLQVAVESGIPGLLAFLWLWYVIFRSLYQTSRQMPQEAASLKVIALGLLGAVVAFFVQGFFEHNFGDSESVMMMWFVIALSLKIQALTSPEQASYSPCPNSADHA